MARKYTVFTYGSLMKGFYGHSELMQNAEYLGAAGLRGELRFFCSDYPILIHNETNSPVKGELYRVDTETMKELRKYEGLKDPFTCYTEKEVKVHTEKGDKVARAFVVAPILEFPILFTSRHIPERDWRVFVSKGKRLPIPKPLALLFGACILSAAVYELMHGIGLI